MIYQCYFKPEQQSSLFEGEVYTGFGLEPSCNPKLFENCPELEDPDTRLALTEYACFLWHWRNPKDNPDSWFGTTSYRQDDKTKVRLKDKQFVTSILSQHDILAWGFYQFLSRSGSPITIDRHTRICHEGMIYILSELLKPFDELIPKDFFLKTRAAMANYWTMKSKDFYAYMDWSWPKVEYALDNIHKFSDLTSKWQYGTVSPKKAVGYFMERLFVIWYLKEGKSLATNEPMPLYHGK